MERKVKVMISPEIEENQEKNQHKKNKKQIWITETINCTWLNA